jgi:2-polyprenyl-3-methyl-5-hydroxy-6-metoxy-1,4-benzoquinol methylase
MKWKKEIRNCPVCESGDFKTLGQRGGNAHRDGIGEETTVVRCKACGSTYARPMMIPLENPYSDTEKYFSTHDSNQRIAEGKRLALIAESILGHQGKVLEIGCGRGENLIGAVQAGWEAFGVEMTEEFAELGRSNGIEIEIASAEESKLLEKPDYFEAILLVAILEHLYNPVEILRKVYGALKPGGVIFIDVPNEGALNLAVGNIYMRARGRDWTINLSPTFPPFHVIGYTPKSLRLIIERAGFEILELAVPKYTNTLPKGSSVLRRVEHAGMSFVQTVGALVGKGDGLVCWARKQ